MCFFTLRVPCCDVSYNFRIKTMFDLSIPTVVCRKDHVLFALFVFDCVYWYSTHIVLSFCVAFLRLVYPMLPVSLDCQFWLPLRLVASFSGLSVFDYPFVLCTLCYQFLWIVSFWLPLRLVYPMMLVSLDC